MEEWEKKIIVKNMNKLVEATICNVRLLAELQASGILGEDDLDDLMALGSNRGNQVHQLYSILQKRVNAFEALLEGLQQTNQSGAVAILTKDLEQNSNAITLIISYDANTILGNGSYGTVVYKGKFGERDVAVKKVHLSMFAGGQALHEVKVLKDVDAHENVVRYFGAKQTKEFILIALELCELSLNEWVENNAKNGTLTLDKTAEFPCMEVLRQITAGLEWLHSKKIVHRDIKPENVLLLLQMKRAKLSDFGLSRCVQDGNSFVATSNAGGTPGWMAPEILACVVKMKSTECKFTYASDVFSLGCVYYYVLTDGKYAFGDSVRCQANILDGKLLIRESELKLKHCSETKSLLNLIQLMISKDPKSRPDCGISLSYLVHYQNNSSLGYLRNIPKPSLPSTSRQHPAYDDYPVKNKVGGKLTNVTENAGRTTAAEDKNTSGKVDSKASLRKSESKKPHISFHASPLITTGIPIWSGGEKSFLPSIAQQKKIDYFINFLKEVDLKTRSIKLNELTKHEDLCIIQAVLDQGGVGSQVKITELSDFYERTMLHAAMERGDYNILEYLIDAQGFSEVLSNTMGTNNFIHDCMRCIHESESREYENTCKILGLLFSKGPHLVESRDASGWTPLHVATSRKFTNEKQIEFIAFLLKHNANVNAKTKNDDYTPLHCAVRDPVPTNVNDILRLLIAHGADTQAVNKNGYEFWAQKRQ